MNKTLRPFHLAFPVDNLQEARNWYANVLGCEIGRESPEWIDFNLFGHQVVAHLSNGSVDSSTNEVDGEEVPIRHFGVILKSEDWIKFKDEMESKGVEFFIKPITRFKGKPGEQSTLFLKDPSGNALEFKSFSDDRMIFQK
mgnify:CR=1 FL=1